MIADNFKYVWPAVCATSSITSVQCFSHQLHLQKVVWRLWLYNVFWVQAVAPSGRGNYPQNPTNLRVELRKLKFVAEKSWDGVSRVESQGGKGNTGSKGEAALAWPVVPRGRDHTALHCPPPPSALEQVSTSELFRWVTQWSVRGRANFLGSTGKYRCWESGSWDINVKNKSNLCSYREHWSGNFTWHGQSEF